MSTNYIVDPVAEVDDNDFVMGKKCVCDDDDSKGKNIRSIMNDSSSQCYENGSGTDAPDRKRTWNVTNPKVSFASIVKSQQQSQQQSQQTLVDECFQRALESSLIIKSKEDDDLELAIQLSLQENDSNNSKNSTATNELNNSDNLKSVSDNDEAIAKELSRSNNKQEDDNEKYNESLALAMYLQALEDSNNNSSLRHRRQEGNVQSVYAKEFQSMRNQKEELESGRQNERILWSHEDAEQHDLYYRQIKEQHLKESNDNIPNDDNINIHQYGDDDTVDAELSNGDTILNNSFFQMNSNSKKNNSNNDGGKNQHDGGWKRINRHSIISPDGKQVRTKHDVQLNKNLIADKIHSMEGSIESGKDYGGATNTTNGMNIDNVVYEAFRRDMKKQSGMVKGVAISGHGRAENMNDSQTRGGGMDGIVRKIITKAINANLITQCHGVVKEGKEALVYYAQPNVAIKVFKRITEFRNRIDYISGDPRYHTKRNRNKKLNPNKRELLALWTEKEFRNLSRATCAGVPVPKPLYYKDNVLFLRFLGNGNGWPCPQLREVEISKGSSKWTTLYIQLLVSIKQLYHGAKLVHGDLSEYNVLLCPEYLITHKNNYNGQEEDKKNKRRDSNALHIALIDFGQAVDVHHPLSFKFLQRDCKLVRDFFIKQGIATLTEDKQIEYILEECAANDTDYLDNGDDHKIFSMDSNDEETDFMGHEEKSVTESMIDDINLQVNHDDEGIIDRTLKNRHAIPGWNKDVEMTNIENLMKNGT